MAVTEQTPLQAYTANGSTSVFAFGFQLLEAGDLVVLANGVLQIGYTISGLGNQAGGTVTFLVAPASGVRVLMYRDIPLNRATDYQNNGDLLAAVVNKDFDRIWLALQEAAELQTRTLRFPMDSGDPVEEAGFTYTQLASAVAAAYAAGSTADAVTYLPAGTGAVATTVQKALNYTGHPSIFRWLTLAEIVDVQSGAASIDIRAKLQASQDAGLGPIYLPAGVYAVANEVVVKDGCGFVGQNAFWKRRTGYVYSPAQHSVIKYIGASGTNTCVIRASNPAVGVQGTDFAGPDTDDLTNIRLENFTVDANGLADWGIYLYRCGNQANIGSITALGAVKACMLMLGLFASYIGTIGAYSGRGRGFTVGENVFGWSSEYQCYSLHATLIAANNGTDATYVGGGAFDADGCGAFVKAGRGSRIGLAMEGNDGRSCVVGSSGSAGGPCIFEVHYLEGNGAGPRIDYRPADTGIVFRGGFLYPFTAAGTIVQEIIRIESMNNSDVVTDDQGPSSRTEWLLLERLSGSSGMAAFTINSNTYKFRVRDCAEGIQYSNRRQMPEGVFGNGLFFADATLSDTRYINGQTEVDVFVGDGVTTGFTLGGATNGAAAIEVYVNGSLKIPTTHYSVSGTTLTFTGPQTPASGVVVMVKRSNFVLTRAAAGRYVVTFTEDQPDDQYNVDVALIQSVGAAVVFLGTKATTGFEIRTATAASPGTLADTNVFVTFTISRSTFR